MSNYKDFISRKRIEDIPTGSGIGSEGFQSVKMGRKFVGIELKASYFNQAAGNLDAAERETATMI